MPEIPDNQDRELERQHPSLARPVRSGTAAPEPGAQPDAGLAEHGLRAGARQPELAGSGTRAPPDATRTFDTAEGRLSYAELADRLAAPLQAIDVRIRSGEYGTWALDESLLLQLHAALTGTLFPEEAGRYRLKPVQVGAHEPPDAALIAQRMRDYVRNLAERMKHLTGEPDELLLEFLAYAEGELLSIHPFPDLNGRMSRLWLTEVLRRQQLPPVDVVPPDPEFRARYLAALSAADRRDWKPLVTLWKERLSQPAGINEIVLPGCTPAPLAAYLKAMGVLRLVAEAGLDCGGDPEATGFWRDDVFVLRTRLTREQLCNFFLERYRPTPLLSPWNGRAGFLEGEDEEGSSRKGVVILAKMAAGRGIRFKPYRQLIEAIRQSTVLSKLNTARSQEKQLERCKKGGKVFDEALLSSLKAEIKRLKLELLQRLRNELPEEFIPWLDACFVLGPDRPLPAPLLGSGGNEGSMDLSINHLALLMELIDPDSDAASPLGPGLLDHALFNVAERLDTDINAGQLSPGVLGGPNMGVGFSASSLENPWNAALMLEGAYLFSSTASKRGLHDLSPRLSFPFVVETVRSGWGSLAQDESARPELWLPLWNTPSSHVEVNTLLGEGRLTVGSRRAETALDAARAIASFGSDRGVGSFQRFGFYERRGQGYFVCTPIGRFNTARIRREEVDAIADLERRNWLGSVQRYARDSNAPNAFRSAARQLDAALFALTQHASRDAMQAVLHHIGRIEATLNTSPKSFDFVHAPTPRLSKAWATKATDDSVEFRIAIALAGLSLRDANGYAILHTRRHLIAASDATNREGDRKWEPASRLGTWGPGSLTSNLSSLFHRRRLHAATRGAQGEVLASQTGATLGDLAEFLNGGTDDGRIAGLLAGLACVDLRSLDAPRSNLDAVLPPAFTLLKIFFTPESVLRALKWLPEDRSLHLPAEIPARLAANDPQAAVKLAWQRLRALGVKLPGRDPPHVVAANGPRWLAALCIPLTFSETARLLRGLKLESESETITEPLSRRS